MSEIGCLTREERADVRELHRQRVPEAPVVSLGPHLDDGAEVLVARFGREGAQEGCDRRDHANLDFVEVLEKVVERRHQLRLGELAAEDGRLRAADSSSGPLRLGELSRRIPEDL